MVCYAHRDRQAVAVCKNCHRGICQDCAIPDEHGFACSEECHQEILASNDMAETSRMLIASQRGQTPVTTIMLLVLGLASLVWGLLYLIGGESFGWYPGCLGAFFIALGIASYRNMKRSGLRS